MNEELELLIKEICKEENIKYKNVSDNYITILKKENKIRFINKYKFGLNSQIGSILSDDKYAMYEVLKEFNIPVIKYDLIWNRNNQKREEEIIDKINYIKKYFNDNNNHIVLKPNMGYSGNMLFNIDNTIDIEPSFRKLLDYTDTIVANPFYKLKNEHRVIILNNKCRLIYTKNLTNNSWQFNLSKGSIATKITDNNLKDKLINLAFKVYKLLNLSFVSIDIVEDYNNNLYILEINSGVSMTKYLKQHKEDYNKIKNIYRDALLELFKK